MPDVTLLDSGDYTFPAALKDSQLDTIEQNHLSWQPIRRAALALLCRDADTLAAPLRANDDEAGQTLLYLAEQLDDFLAWRETETEMLKAAHARLWLTIAQEADRLEAGETGEGAE